MIIDAVTYNGEAEIWDIHYNVLRDAVDKFIVVEFDKTFTGHDKPLYGSQIDWKKYPKAEYKVHYEELYSKYDDLAQQSPNARGADHWKREFSQKESLRDALAGLNPDDIVFIGDVDEVWDPSLRWQEFSGVPLKLKLEVYAYWLNNRSSEQFYGTLCTSYYWVKATILNHLRTESRKGLINVGWHFTSMGGLKEVRRKLNDSYTEESYNTKEVQELLSTRLTQNQDYLGRDFNFTVDETNWPQYLKDNRQKFAHLCKGTALNIGSEHQRYDKRGAYRP